MGPQQEAGGEIALRFAQRASCWRIRRRSCRASPVGASRLGAASQRSRPLLLAPGTIVPRRAAARGASSELPACRVADFRVLGAAQDVQSLAVPSRVRRASSECREGEDPRSLRVHRPALERPPYLLGDHFTVADAYLFTIFTWSRPVRIDLAPWPRLVAYRDGVAARPAVREAMRAEGLLQVAA